MADVKWAMDERKLASAYDDLFQGRYKAVQNAMDKILKKNPKSQPGLVLRLRLQLAIQQPEEKIVEGFEKVKATGDLSSQSAWHITYVLKQINRLDLLVDYYRKLWDDHPEKLEYATELLSNALSLWDMGTVVGVTRKLFNATRNPVWAQRAAWAEWVSNGTQPTAETPFPPPSKDLKSLMTCKILLTTSKTESTSSDVLWLRLQILIASDSLKQALEIAQEDTPGSSLARYWYRIQAVPIILHHLGEDSLEAWEKEWEWVVGKLNDDSEAAQNYAFYRYLIECAQACQHMYEETLDRLRELHEKIGDKERSPLLAILELDSKSPQDRRIKKEDWLRNVEAYWARWGCKGPVVSELEGVVAGDQTKLEAVLALMEERSKSDHSDLQAYREVVNSTLFLLRQKPQTWKPEEEDVKRLWSLYTSGLVYGRNLPSTDIQHSDDIGLAAVQLLLIKWSLNKPDERDLLRSITCLKYIISKSPSSTFAKCLLTRSVRLAGASQMIPEDFFGDKGPSEVQLDTVSHLAIDRSSVEAHLSTIHPEWQSVMDQIKRMHQKTAIDVPEWTKQGVLRGSYAKIPSMRLLSHRLSHSLFSATSRIEHVRHGLLTGQEPHGSVLKQIKTHVEQAKEGGLVDNRDWEVVGDAGGNLPAIKDLVRLGNGVSDGWVKAWGSLLTVLAAFKDGLTLDIEQVDDDSLSSAEKTLINGFAKLGQWLQKAKAGEKAEVGDIFTYRVDGNSGSRWEIIYNIHLIVEAIKYLDIIFVSIDEASKPQGTGKAKKKADPVYAEISSSIRSLKAELQSRAGKCVVVLDTLAKEDEGIEGKCIVFEDFIEFCSEIGKEVVAARRVGLQNLKKLLVSKK